MKFFLRLFIFTFLVMNFVFISNLRAEKQATAPTANPDSVEIFMKGQGPTRSFRLMTPISEKAKNDQEAFKKMKKNAAKLGADAVVDYECEAVTKGYVYGGWGGSGAQSVCHGSAVKWQ